MVTRIIEQVTDDLDGSDGAHTNTVGLNGLVVEIDLSDEHAAELLAFLRPYLDAGRRVAGKRLVPRIDAGKPNTPPAVIRDWWQNNPEGLPTWQRNGMIPTSVHQAWNAHLAVLAAQPGAALDAIAKRKTKGRALL